MWILDKHRNVEQVLWCSTACLCAGYSTLELEYADIIATGGKKEPKLFVLDMRNTVSPYFSRKLESNL